MTQQAVYDHCISDRGQCVCTNNNQRDSASTELWQKNSRKAHCKTNVMNINNLAQAQDFPNSYAVLFSPSWPLPKDFEDTAW